MATIQPIKDLYLPLETAQKHMETVQKRMETVQKRMETVQEQTAKKLKDIDLQMETAQKLNDLCLQLVSVVCWRVTIVAWFLISLVAFGILLPVGIVNASAWMMILAVCCGVFVPVTLVKLKENIARYKNTKVEITKCIAELEEDV